VAAIAAELLEADLYIATSIDGVYDRDPGAEGAEKLDEVTPEKLKGIIDGNNEAGRHELIDSTAVEIIERSRTETKIFEGTFGNIKRPGGADGTRIVHE